MCGWRWLAVYRNTVVSGFLVPFAPCTLQSLMWFKYWSREASHYFQWRLACETQQFQYCAWAIAGCNVRTGLDTLKRVHIIWRSSTHYIVTISNCIIHCSMLPVYSLGSMSTCSATLHHYSYTHAASWATILVDTHVCIYIRQMYYSAHVLVNMRSHPAVISFLPQTILASQTRLPWSTAGMCTVPPILKCVWVRRGGAMALWTVRG